MEIYDSIVHQAIEQIVLEGHTVLQIVMPNGNTRFFSVYKFVEGFNSSAMTIDFNTVEGVDITDFLTKHSASAVNNIHFLTLFNNVIKDGVVLRLEFTKTSIWYKWSCVNRK